MIKYTSSINDIMVENLDGFFVGWVKPLSSEKHYLHLSKCVNFVAALDDSKVVGFVSAISDGIGCASIPLIEVLPQYQKQGIGSELMSHMLEILNGFYTIDLMCDKNVQGFYERFGMKKLTGMGLRKVLCVFGGRCSMWLNQSEQR